MSRPANLVSASKMDSESAKVLVQNLNNEQQFFYRYGEELTREGEYRMALEALFEARNLELDNPELHYLMAYNFNRLGIPNMALACADKATVLKHDHLDARCEKIMAYNRIKAYQRALIEADKIWDVEKNNRSPSSRSDHYRGETHYLSGIHLAIHAFKMAAELNGASPKLSQNLEFLNQLISHFYADAPKYTSALLGSAAEIPLALTLSAAAPAALAAAPKAINTTVWIECSFNSRSYQSTKLLLSIRFTIN